MADISKYIREFEEAPDGSFARIPIIDALTAINSGGDASSINGITSEMLLLKHAIFNKLYFDEIPTMDSLKLVTSRGIFDIFGDVRRIDVYEPFEDLEEGLGG